MNAAAMEKQIWNAYLDWSGFLANPRFCRANNRVAWSRFDVGIIREPVTFDKVRSLVESKQYSFQCAEDGSVFQLFYEFSQDSRLVLARLAFYKLSSSVEELDLKVGPIPERSGLVPWIRFDYNLDHASGVLHCASHLHIWGFNDARLVVDGVPGPRQFVELVAAMCYPDYYRVHRLTDAGEFADPGLIGQVNVHCVQASGSGAAQNLVHVRIPGRAWF